MPSAWVKKNEVKVTNSCFTNLFGTYICIGYNYIPVYIHNYRVTSRRFYVYRYQSCLVPFAPFFVISCLEPVRALRIRCCDSGVIAEMTNLSRSFDMAHIDRSECFVCLV